MLLRSRCACSGVRFLSVLAAADDLLHLRIVRIEPVVARLLVAVAVVGQVDVDELLCREARGLAFGVFADLPAEDDAGDAAVLAGHLAIGAAHQAAEEKRVRPREVFQFRERAV